jgi:hypothetical protein
MDSAYVECKILCGGRWQSSDASIHVLEAITKHEVQKVGLLSP